MHSLVAGNPDGGMLSDSLYRFLTVTVHDRLVQPLVHLIDSGVDWIDGLGKELDDKIVDVLHNAVVRKTG
jgi:hypothetical protein